MFTPKRIIQEELLDEHDAPRADMERSLRDLRRINRFLGGVTTYRRVLKRMLPDLGRKKTVVLELGAGTADLLDALPASVFGIATDIKIEHLLYLRKGSRARRVVCDAMHLPLRPQSVDAITSAHFFHHFTEEENRAILTGALPAVRRGIAINDTRRHFAPLTFVRLLSALRLVGRITRFDAPASVLRGYTTVEAGEVGQGVPASRAETIQIFPFRFGLLLWK